MHYNQLILKYYQNKNKKIIPEQYISIRPSKLAKQKITRSVSALDFKKQHEELKQTTRRSVSMVDFTKLPPIEKYVQKHKFKDLFYAVNGHLKFNLMDDFNIEALNTINSSQTLQNDLDFINYQNSLKQKLQPRIGIESNINILAEKFTKYYIYDLLMGNIENNMLYIMIEKHLQVFRKDFILFQSIGRSDYRTEYKLYYKLDKQYQLHHLDCNKKNDTLENLIPLKQDEHDRVHKGIDSFNVLHDFNQIIKKQAILDEQDIKIRAINLMDMLVNKKIHSNLVNDFKIMLTAAFDLDLGFFRKKNAVLENAK